MPCRFMRSRHHDEWAACRVDTGVCVLASEAAENYRRDSGLAIACSEMQLGVSASLRFGLSSCKLARLEPHDDGDDDDDDDNDDDGDGNDDDDGDDDDDDDDGNDDDD
eukprot:2380131-Rhodomonas_salina.1